ncbi:hypothetical protein Moror_11681 [Moniliophthora roreri MCA 2997]|uniref:Uncharacterized protein n=2 Tax=Moniliophthora roreri TaxID=221103 RepID=V2X3P8_MONRO|nr:hypothetical protein Moror_11681 [Moniliophthora roreri MCA 2997]KAI3619811.1 hypothetical protein WG66_002698 [Moniliophthora roreri]
MKFNVATQVLLAATTAVPAPGSLDDANYGVISPAAGTEISINTPLNVTLNPARYFKESTRGIDVFLIRGTEIAAPKRGHEARGVVTDLKPNYEVIWETHSFLGYQVNIDLTQLERPNSHVRGEYTVLIKESYQNYMIGSTQDFWSQTISITD